MLKPIQLPNLPVLLIDESAFIRRNVRAMLEQCGIRQVVEAADGGDALVRLGQFRPELIILDWSLPVIEGPQLMDLIRDPRNGGYEATPVVLMTSSPTQRVLELATARGIGIVLRKPFSPNVLWTRLAKLVGPRTVQPAPGNAAVASGPRSGRGGRFAI